MYLWFNLLHASIYCASARLAPVPGCGLSLADFETLAVQRLKLLRILEKHSLLSAVKF